ncbi:MAG: sugar-binding protein [Planctomycetota bacterium]
MTRTERPVALFAVMLVCVAALGERACGGENLLPNAAFAKARSGYWPDWWNWYNALGNDRINLDECWQVVDEHYVPGTRSVKLASGAQAQTSFLRILFQKEMPLTLSAWMKSDSPDTKVSMVVYQDGWNAINEVSEVTVGTEWRRYHVTVTPAKKSEGQHNFVKIGLAGPGTLWVNAPKLEEGVAPTEWKLSPRDLPKGEEAQEPVAPKFAVPRIDCLKVEHAPAIDGELDDGAWKEATATDHFTRLDETAPAKCATDAYICRDDQALYVAFRCHEPEMDKLTAKATLRDAVGVFQDDCVEVLISANEDGSDYLRFAANAAGTKVDSKGFTMFFDAEWECATGKGEGFWTVEFRLPFGSLVRPLQPGSAWRLNLARYRARPKEEEYSAWAPVVRTFHDFAHFGTVYGMVAEVGRAGGEPAGGGKLVAYLDRSFYTNENEAKLFVDAPAGTPVRFTLNGAESEEALRSTRLLSIRVSGLADGSHAIKVAAGERRADVRLMKLPPKEGAVKIDRVHRIFLVNDKPFIPVGSNADAKRVKQQADLGLSSGWTNMHEAFTKEAQEKVRGILDAARERAMKIIVWYQDYALTDDHAKWEAELLDVVNTFKDHPAILAWFVFDEPVSNIQWLAGLCDTVRNADPYHPVFVNWCDRGHGWTSEMGDVTGDVNCLDGYYINAYDYTPHEAYLKIGGHCSQMTADAKTRGNVVAYVNGIYGWADAIREPSPAEHRFVTYVSLIRGARMLLYYNWGPPANAALRDSFPPLCREIETLTPIVAGVEVKGKVACDNERIDHAAFEAPDALYVIALNTDERDEEAGFRVEGARGEAAVLFEDRSAAVTNGSFRDRFAPLERHVYRLSMK